jgi:hypothetical protein
LVDSFVGAQDRIPAMINYESVLISLNDSGKLKEKLVLVYPTEGIVTADYPIMLLSADKRALYDKVLAHVRGPAFQRAVATRTFRKPINPDVAEGADLYPKALVEIAFPRSLEVVDAILLAFANELRLPADATFVLDTSGSMVGPRLTQLRTAMGTLAAGDGSLTGRVATGRGRDEGQRPHPCRWPRQNKVHRPVSDLLDRHRAAVRLEDEKRRLEPEASKPITERAQIGYDPGRQCGIHHGRRGPLVFPHHRQ